MRIVAAVRSNLPERSSRAGSSNGALCRTARMLLGLVVVAVLFLPPAASGQNIVIVVIDDAGVERFGTFGVPGEDGVPGSAAAPTPTIDSIAATGVRFDNFWAYPLCSPFRASLLTGLGPWEHGVSTVPSFSASSTSNRYFGLDASTMNIAHMLSDEGYRTEAFGKWHMGGADHEPHVKFHPIHSGFDLFDGGLGNPGTVVDGTQGVTGYFAWERCFGTSDPPITVTCELEDEYSTRYITERAIECVERLEEPFLCYVAYNAAHVPFHDPPDSLYDPPLGDPNEPCEEDVNNPGTFIPNRACHKEMLEALDRDLDDLIGAINFTNTTLFVVSDNGTMNKAADDGPYPTEPQPLGHNKATVYQGGLHTPLIVKGQAVDGAVAGMTVEAIVQTTDIFATLAWIAKSKVTIPPESVSLKRYLTDPEAQPLRETVMAELFLPTGIPKDEYGDPMPPIPDITETWFRSSRDERYKLIWNFKDAVFTEEFFDFQVGSEEFDELLPLDTDNLTPFEESAYQTLVTAIRPDLDGDGTGDNKDNCLFLPNNQDDFDGDGVGDACDNCPQDPNPDQKNSDGEDDGGNACDPDDDDDGVLDDVDNCREDINVGQDDTDLDDCGNLCDADYDNSGTVGFADFGQHVGAFGTTDMEKCHSEPIPGCIVSFSDFGFFVRSFGKPPGPSGTTVGTTACP